MMTERALDLSFNILGRLMNNKRTEYHVDISGLTHDEIEGIKDYFSINEIILTENEMIIKVKRVI